HPPSASPVGNLSEYRMLLRKSNQQLPLNNTHKHRFTVQEWNHHESANLRTPTNDTRPYGIQPRHRSHRNNPDDGIACRGRSAHRASLPSTTATHWSRASSSHRPIFPT